jgi:hypothetical protein
MEYGTHPDEGSEFGMFKELWNDRLFKFFGLFDDESRSIFIPTRNFGIARRNHGVRFYRGK